MPQSTFSGNGGIAPFVTPLFPLAPDRYRSQHRQQQSQDGRHLWRRGEPRATPFFTFRSRHKSVERMYHEATMSTGDSKEIFLTGACLQEQVDRVMKAQSIAKVNEIKPVLEKMAKAHLELLTKRLEGSEKKEGAALRQEAAPIEPFENLGYQQTGSANGKPDDELSISPD